MDEIKQEKQDVKKPAPRGNAVAFALLLGGGYALLRLMDGLLRIAGVG